MSRSSTLADTTPHVADAEKSERVGEPASNVQQSSVPNDEERVLPIAGKDGPPDGGLVAWTQVFASYFLFFNTWGMINSFGAFQTYYDAVLPRSPSDVAWIGTFQGFLLLFVGAVSGPLFDKGYLRHLLVIGTFLVSFGLMMTSIATEYYQIFLAQGVAVGLGCGCLFISSLTIPAQYFTTKRALAMGIVASGGSMGAIIYPIVFRRLEAEVSFGWATRAMGFIGLGTLLVPVIFLKSRLPPSGTARALIDPQALRNPQFMLFAAAQFFYFLGLYMPFFYISAWAQQYLNTDEDLSFYLFSILNAGSLFGRIIPGMLADRMGSVNTIIPMIGITSMMLFAWIGVHSNAELIVFCIFYGFFSGASVSLPGTILVGIVPEMPKIGTWMGMNFSITSFGLLVGSPIAGAILDASPGGSFVPAQCFSGAMVFVGTLCLCAVRYLKGKKADTWKI